MDQNRAFLQRTLSPTDSDDPAEKNRQGGIETLRRVAVSSSSSSSTRKLLGSTCFWVGFGLFGWYFPRSIIHRETSILSLEPPYQISGGETVIVDFELNQPLVDPPTVDNFLLRSTSIWFPFVFSVIHSWYTNIPYYSSTDAVVSARKHNVNTSKKLYFIATVISAFSAALGLSEGCTVMIKLWVKRRRPNFYALCGFDSVTKKCMANLEHVREANFSFPSGHSSLVCCGMTFLVWYLHGTSGTANNIRHIESSRLFSLVFRTCLPGGWALFVAASRLVDHWHHPSDVLAGLGLGFVASTIAYHHWYPPVWSPYAGIPRALLILKTSNSLGEIAMDTSTSMIEAANVKRRQHQTENSDDIA